jgi:secreted Zn-dependent insulinase-like peptidase
VGALSEPVYDTKYSCEPVEPALLAAWAGVAAEDHPELHLPKPNRFVSDDFAIKPPPAGSCAVPDGQALAAAPPPADPALGAAEEGEGEGEEDNAETAAAAAAAAAKFAPALSLSYPVCLRKDDRASVWFKQDVTFRKPKAVAYCRVSLPAAYASPSAAVACQLFTMLVEDSLSEFAYDAELASLQ